MSEGQKFELQQLDRQKIQLDELHKAERDATRMIKAIEKSQNEQAMLKESMIDKTKEKMMLMS